MRAAWRNTEAVLFTKALVLLCKYLCSSAQIYIHTHTKKKKARKICEVKKWEVLGLAQSRSKQQAPYQITKHTYKMESDQLRPGNK